MMFEDARDMYMLYSISPELTCTCDEFHECQQCYEERQSASRNSKKMTYGTSYDMSTDSFTD
jgi:hypothetical protein